MPRGKGHYRFIRLEPADNGFIVNYDLKVENPMEKQSNLNPDRFRWEDKTQVFEMDDETSMEQALDRAVGVFKNIHLANLGLLEPSEKSGNTGHGSHNTDHQSSPASAY